MSEILKRSEIDDLLDHIINSIDDWRDDVDALLAHDAALRSENERLREALREIDQKTGHFGEAPPPPEWMPMLSLIAWVGRTARAALAGQEVGRAAQERKEDRWLGSDMTEEGDR